MKFSFLALFLNILSCFAFSQSLITSSCGLKYLEQKNITHTKTASLIILLHGYGSNEEDLISLHSQLPSNAIVLSVQAPNVLQPNSYAWYNIEFDNGIKSYNIAQSDSSTALIAKFIEEVQLKYKLKTSQTYIGGFSQGGIMSYNIGLMHPQLVKGIFVLSGRLLQETESKLQSFEKLKQLKIFIAHGNQDQMINIKEAKAAMAFLKQRYINFEWHEYNMAHSISNEEMKDLKKWMEGK